MSHRLLAHPARVRPGPFPRRGWRALRALLLAVALAATAGTAFAPWTRAATTYYVATTGNDANPGTLSRPWRTVGKAARTAPAGSTILIRGGTYAAFEVVRPSLTFRRYGTEAVTISAGSVTDAIRVTGTHDIVIRGLTARGAPATYGAGIRVSDSIRVTIAGCRLLANRSFGAAIQRSQYVTVRDSLIRRNETGIEISGDGKGVVIKDNRITDNNRMIVNDGTPYNDRGANGISFYRTTGPITVDRNVISGNRAVSTDYGYDGGAFEIYAASGITIKRNRLFNNENVIETGTDGAACSGLRFYRNVAYGGNDGGRPSMGLILRCASNAVIAHNTFYDLSSFVYYVTESGAFSGAVNDVRILNNIAYQPSAKIYSFSSVPGTMTIDRNLAWNASGASIAWVNGFGNTASLATFRSWTGFDLKGIQAKPRFRDRAAYDFRLRSTSPAIDRGIVVSGVTGAYRGKAPDMGRYEY